MTGTHSEQIDSIDLRTQFEDGNIDLPSLDVEEEIENGIARTSLPSGFHDAIVTGIDVTEHNSEDYYEVYYTFYGIDWVARFSPHSVYQMNYLSSLLERYNVDPNAAANLIGKRVTIYNKQGTPILITTGPSTSELQELTDDDKIIVTLGSLRYCSSIQLKYNLLVALPLVLPIAVALAQLSIIATIPLFIGSAIFIIIGAMFHEGPRPKLPNISTYTKINKIVSTE